MRELKRGTEQYKKAFAGIAVSARPDYTGPRKKRTATPEHRDDDQRTLLARRRAGLKAKAKKAEHEKVVTAAIKFAKRRLKWWVDRGVFKEDYEKQDEGANVAHLHGRVSDFIGELANAQGRTAELDYLIHIAAASDDWGKCMNECARKLVESLPDDEKKFPADVKDYILNHLLRNFEDPKRLRAYRSLGRGEKLPKKTRDSEIAETVELMVHTCGLTAKKSAGCVEQALKQLGVSMPEPTIRDIYRKSEAKARIRKSIEHYYEVTSEPLDLMSPAYAYEVELVTGRQPGEHKREAYNRRIGIAEKRAVDAFLEARRERLEEEAALGMAPEGEPEYDAGYCEECAKWAFEAERDEASIRLDEHLREVGLPPEED
jgi:hypothetical protein